VAVTEYRSDAYAAADLPLLAADVVVRPAARLRLPSRAALGVRGAVAFLVWFAAAGADAAAAGWALGLALLSVVALGAALDERAEYTDSASVRVARALVAAVLVTLVGVGAGALVGGVSPSDLLLGGAGLFAVGALSASGLVRPLVRRRPLRVATVGMGSRARRLAECFEREQPAGFEFVGVVDDGSGPVPVTRSRLLGRLDELPSTVRKHEIDVLVLTSRFSATEALERVLALPGSPPVVLELSAIY
jgi:hypothetical protein